MSSANKTLKILIAGGGVAGLTLATMLEKFEIEYLVLESHGEIAPAVGASIGLFPNGLRILDQIDRYEPLLKFMDSSKDILFTRDKSGKPLLSLPNFLKHVEHRHGYPLMFFDRQRLLQSLYEGLQNKSRILLNKKVAQIDLIEGGVEVITTGGEKFYGSLIVGADGVHSAVRQEMYRIGNKLQPGYFPVDEQDRVPCHYLCSYGIAQRVPGWVSGHQCTVLGNGVSQLVVSGAEDRVYWFFFSKLPETKYGKDIPKCSKEMETQFIDKNAHVRITPQVTFGQLYAKRLISTLTPLHEFVCKKWFFDRMIIFGDSAHKPNPIGGQGGNGAIESAADFVNALLQKKDDRAKSLTGLTDEDVKYIFTEMQAARHERAEQIVGGSRSQQSLVAYEKPLTSTLIFQFLAPLKGDEGFLAQFASLMMGGTRLKKLAIKNRPRSIPFTDELPAQPLKESRLVQMIFSGLMAYLLLIAVKTLRRPSSRLDLWDRGAQMMPLSPSLEFVGDDPERVLYVFHLSSQLISPILICIIEGYRLGNIGTILAFPSLFLVAIQSEGIGRVAPIYAVLGTFLSYDLPTGRFVRPEVVYSLLWALSLGYLLPMAFMIASILNGEISQTWPSVWQFAPLFVCILTYVLTSVWRLWTRSGLSKEEKDYLELDRYKGLDVSVLQFIYSFAFAVQTTAYFAVLVYAYHQPSISITNGLFGLPNLISRGGSIIITDITSQISHLLSCEIGIATATWLISNLYSVWSLRRLGYIRTGDMFVPMLAVIAGQVLVGPSATWAGLWYWREGVLSGLKRE
ncbi:putative monooxygenase [Amylocarpus encephaloides]|uniref:Monooxygenase n=1 Tax=Amylocarpus encephaloides TaxID=45428 RepID=A0A9P7YEM4_9HELO|nr:putative monooxygenase [Amylocarpus encephaloides]